MPELRFKVNDKVECRTGDDEWTLGKVVKIWYRENTWPKEQLVPYQMRLDDGTLIYAPQDDDMVIRDPDQWKLIKDGKIPVTILTGFLGAGKTTLLNYILKANHGKKYAVIENEVGAVGIDNQLLMLGKKTEETIIVLDNGCLCCTVRGDLITAIREIVDAAAAKKGDAARLDGILIETTGIADPGPIVKTFYSDAFCTNFCKVDGVLTVVDAVHFVEQLTRERSEGAVNESAQQVAFADKVLLNKVDAAGPEKLAQALEAIRSVNQFVPVTKCSLGKDPAAVPLSDLLSIDAFDLSKMMGAINFDLTTCGISKEPEKEEDEEDEEEQGHGGAHGHGHEEEGHGHGHSEEHGHGGECAEDCEDESHGAGHAQGHGHGHGHSFRHDTEINSFVCEMVGKPLDPMRLNLWIQELLESNAENLYRYKGIVAVRHPHHGKPSRMVIQGVHDMCTRDVGDLWPEDVPIKSQLVLIGRKLVTGPVEHIGSNRVQ